MVEDWQKWFLLRGAEVRGFFTGAYLGWKSEWFPGMLAPQEKAKIEHYRRLEEAVESMKLPCGREVDRDIGLFKVKGPFAYCLYNCDVDWKTCKYWSW